MVFVPTDKQRKMRKKEKVNYMIIGIIFGILIWLGIEIYTDNKIRNKRISETQYAIQNVSTQYQTEEIIQEEYSTDDTETQITKQYPKEEVINEYKGYPVLAKLEIPTIHLETYILQKYSEEALNVSVTKFWGANPNEKGNFCIAGHNFQNKNMFHDLKKLEIGDRLFISDNKIGKIEYEVYDLYKVLPEDVSCLSQETKQKREVTLITCTSDSKERIIVKAREVE